MSALASYIRIAGIPLSELAAPHAGRRSICFGDFQ